MAHHSFLFIPDISGFTRFVNSTEISHSQHIISELLELIIDSDELGLEVSEVEGDAVLFFGKEEVPSPEKILEQVKKTFIKFHEHLTLYETQRICQCGACSTASHLSLKFVAHSGEMQMINVKGGEKPYGPAVIMAHRLLKNEIPSSEYVLVTEQALGEVEPEMYIDGKSVTATPGHMEYEDAGTAEFKFLPLKNLHNELQPPPKKKLPKLTKDPVRYSVHIERPKEEVFEIIINFEHRLKWNRGVNELNYNEKEVNRVGSEHNCLVGKDLLAFETITNDFGMDKMVYGERILKAPFAKDIAVYYILEEENEGTKLIAEVHIEPSPLIGHLLKPLIKKKLGQSIRKALDAIKEVMEDGAARTVSPDDLSVDQQSIL